MKGEFAEIPVNHHDPMHEMVPKNKRSATNQSFNFTEGCLVAT